MFNLVFYTGFYDDAGLVNNGILNDEPQSVSVEFQEGHGFSIELNTRFKDLTDWVVQYIVGDIRDTVSSILV